MTASDSVNSAPGIDLDRLRSVLQSHPSRSVFVVEDGVGDEELTPASVLFPIVLRQSGPSVLLTQRTAHLKDHPGQISFPGGRVEPADDSPAATALREAQEEIGLAARHVEILGYLPEYRTGTGFRVTPVVAVVKPPFDLRPEPGEVAEIFEVPFSFLMDPANAHRFEVDYRGGKRTLIEFRYHDYRVWGATAAMLVNFRERLERAI